MTTETRTDRPQIDTSRMNNDDHAYVTPAPRAPRSGHRNDRPSERRDFDQDLQHYHETIRPSYWSAFPETTSTSLTPRVRTSLTPRVRTSLNPRARTSLTPRSPRTRTSPTSLGTRTRTSPKARTCPNQASPMLTRQSITKTLSRFSISTKPLSIATDMTELDTHDTLDRPRLQRHDAGSLVYANTDIPSMEWSAMRTPRSTTATTPWRRIASIR